MKHISPKNLMTILILIPVIIFIKLVQGFPWWSFVIPVLLLGLLVTLKKWKIACFGVGFLSGFIAWSGALVFFHQYYDGVLLERINYGKILIPVVSGLLGGILTGLALVLGKLLVSRKSSAV
jgi:hypothetical protein